MGDKLQMQGLMDLQQRQAFQMSQMSHGAIGNQDLKRDPKGTLDQMGPRDGQSSQPVKFDVLEMYEQEQGGVDQAFSIFKGGIDTGIDLDELAACNSSRMSKPLG